MGDMAEKEEGNALALAETKPGMDSSSASSSKARCNPEEQPLFLDMADGKRGKRRRTRSVTLIPHPHTKVWQTNLKVVHRIMLSLKQPTSRTPSQTRPSGPRL